MYVELQDNFRRNKKVVRLARTLGIKRAEARGLLTGLWTELLTQAPDGDLTGLDPEEVEEMADWEGEPGTLYRALLDERPAGEEPRHRFIERTGARLVIHDWEEHTKGLKRASYMREYRANRKSEDANTRVTHAERTCNVLSDPIRSDQIRSEQSDSAREAVADEHTAEPGDMLGADHFAAAEAVEVYNEHRHPSLPAWTEKPPASVIATMRADLQRETQAGRPVPGFHRRGEWRRLAERTHGAKFVQSKRWDLAMFFKGEGMRGPGSGADNRDGLFAGRYDEPPDERGCPVTRRAAASTADLRRAAEEAAREHNARKGAANG